MKPICAPDCPNRSPTCHASCEIYLRAREERQKNRKPSRPDEATSVLIEGCRKTKKRLNRK